MITFLKFKLNYVKLLINTNELWIKFQTALREKGIGRVIRFLISVGRFITISLWSGWSRIEFNNFSNTNNETIHDWFLKYDNWLNRANTLSWSILWRELPNGRLLFTVSVNIDIHTLNHWLHWYTYFIELNTLTYICYTTGYIDIYTFYNWLHCPTYFI